jgi:hypothetical protein
MISEMYHTHTPGLLIQLTDLLMSTSDGLRLCRMTAVITPNEAPVPSMRRPSALKRCPVQIHCLLLAGVNLSKRT